MNDFLNIEICKKFRKAINETDIFVCDEEYKEHYNLFCAVMDRVDSSIAYLNNNANLPKTEESLLVFIMYSCMILDAVKQLQKVLDLKNKYSDPNNEESYKFFKSVCTGYPLNISQKECPTDDKFFEYLRSLSMAHPFETSRPKFFKKGEIQYSPWVIANSEIMNLRGVKDGIGIRIYSNRFDEIQDLFFSFNLLKAYINSRFILMERATEKVYQIIADKEKIWEKDKVPKDLPPIATLEKIVEILKKRYEDTYIVECAIKYLSSPLTEPANEDIVTSYREVITDLIPNLIEAVEKLDYEKMAMTLDKVLYARPRKVHEMAHYQLEKIFDYLDIGYELSSNYDLGLQQARNFSDQLAKKWVKINTGEMNADEIKLLVRVACYFEKKEQEQF
ncbi:hypothetical protein [Clostridium sp. UBA1056]|uniref:hypothetical protein n=1 Tax=unclassified Clostridium TaxID=2614128 RepID=UPI0032174FE4